MKNEKQIKVMDMVIDDMENDVQAMEGMEFTGKNVATVLGQQAAAITAIANAVKEILNDGT